MHSIIKNVLVVCFVYCVIPAFGMEQQSSSVDWDKKIEILETQLLTFYYAQEHQRRTPCFDAVFPDRPDPVREYWVNKTKQEEDLKQTIKQFMSWRTVSQGHYTLLTAQNLGELCNKKFPRKVTSELLDIVCCFEIKEKHEFPIAVLAYSGAEMNKTLTKNYWDKSAFYEIVKNNNITLAKIFFKYSWASKNDKVRPLIFQAETVEMAQLFLDNDYNIKVEHKGKLNVISNLIKHGKLFPQQSCLELIEWYIQHGVNTAFICKKSGKSLWHHLVHKWSICADGWLVQVLDILFKSIPTMINCLDKEGRTPLDIFKKRFVGWNVGRMKGESWLMKNGAKTSADLFRDVD